MILRRTNVKTFLLCDAITVQYKNQSCGNEVLVYYKTIYRESMAPYQKVYKYRFATQTGASRHYRFMHKIFFAQQVVVRHHCHPTSGRGPIYARNAQEVVVDHAQEVTVDF